MSLAGGGRRDYAGISSANSDEKSGRRKPKVSWGRQIRPGLVGPKARPKGVVDGQQVNIPVPLESRYYRWGDAEGNVITQTDVCTSLRVACR